MTASRVPRTTQPDERHDGSAGLSVRVLLFAAARDAAGTRELTVDARSLRALLDDLRSRYGPDFAAVLATARVWVNGEDPADLDDLTLTPGDEVAILPPVSGGSHP